MSAYFKRKKLRMILPHHSRKKKVYISLYITLRILVEMNYGQTRQCKSFRTRIEIPTGTEGKL